MSGEGITKPATPHAIASEDPIAALTRLVREGQERNEDWQRKSDLKNEANHALILGQLSTTTTRITGVEGRCGSLEDRVTTLEDDKRRLSGGVKDLARATSEHDMSQDARLAELFVEQTKIKEDISLTKQVLAKLDKIVEDPKVRAVFWAIVLALLAKIGIQLK